MAGPDLARRTGGAGADHDAVEIERDDLGFGSGAWHCDRRCIRQARRRGSQHHRLGRNPGDFGFQPIAQCANPVIDRDLDGGSFGSGSEPDDPRQVFGAGAAPALLAAAAQQRRQLRSAGDHQRADAGRAADLVRREGYKIGADGGDIDRDLAGGLHRVAMK